MTASSRKLVSLDELLVSVKPGFASGEDDPDGVLQFRMNNVDRSGDLDWSSQRRVPCLKKGMEELLLRTGDILFNATNSPELVGKTAYFEEVGQPVTFSNHFLRLRVRTDAVAPKFVACFLKWHFTRGTFLSMSRRWVNQAAINQDQLIRMRVDLPSLQEQRRIVAILDQAEALRAKRRQALAKLDTLTQSLFLEMFGDPRTNPMRWPELPISDIGRVVTGNTPSRATAEYFGEAIDWVKSDNINTPHYYVTRAHERLSEAGKAVSRIVPPQSILVTCIAGSPNCIGNAAMADREVAFNQQINAVVVKEGDPHFVYALVVASKHKIQEASTKGMKGIVSKSRLEQVMLPFPPLHLQRQYGRLAYSMENSKTSSNMSLAHLNLAVSSLQHRAFRGEL